MMYLQHFLLALLSASATLAQDIMKDSSFGYDKTLSPNSFNIPNWSMFGEGHVPGLLSDKVILTPPYGGNKRGALWAELKNSINEWSLEVDFRAGGQDRGSGSLSLWYALDGAKTVSTASVYDVGKFEGFVLLIDTHGGVQSLRGFLNDGSTDYRNHPNVDGLAFGHCNYNYRNLGRPSRIRILSTSAGFEVTRDDMPCFASNNINLPADYTFGMTAASADPPDSFEVFKFILRSSPTSQMAYQPPQQHQEHQSQNQQQQQVSQSDDTPASRFTTSQAQFEDLHSRLHLLSKSITNLFAEVNRHTAAEEAHYQELLRRISTPQSSNLDARIGNLDRAINDLSRELKSSDHKGQFQKLSDQLAQTHLGVSEHLPDRLKEYVQDHTPRIGFIVFSFIGFQCALVVAYVIYKRRRAQAPKKYL